MGGKGKGKQGAKIRWSQWSCQACGTSSHLERDPRQPDVCYCAACWGAWHWYDTNAPRKGSHAKGQNEQGKGKGNGWGAWDWDDTNAPRKGSYAKGQNEQGKGKDNGWGAWDWDETNAPRKGSHAKGQNEQGKGKGNGKHFGEQTKGKTKKGYGKGQKGGGKKGGDFGSQWRPDPPVDEPGEWVPTDEFRGRKSFAYYRCDCRKTWVSAHGYKDYGQGCQSCDVESLPVFMWKNEYTKSFGLDLDDPDKPTRSLDGPHDEERCAACRAGICDFQLQRERRY